MMKPQLACSSGSIFGDKSQAMVFALSSALVGVYLRFYQVSFALLRLMQ